MFRTLFLFTFAILALAPAGLHAAPLHKDCVSAGSGAWSNPAIWTGCDGATPQATDSAYLQAGHVVELTSDAAIADLHLSIGIDPLAPGNGARLMLGSHVLDLHGRLRGYTAPLGGTPGASANRIRPDAITVTSGSAGRMRVVGGSRTLATAGEWGLETTVSASPATLAIEIAADPGAVIDVAGTVFASRWSVTSGTLHATQSLIVDQGIADKGDFAIGPDGTLISDATLTSWVVARPNSRRGGTFTVDGKLILTRTAPRIYMVHCALNNVVEYPAAGNQSLLKSQSGTGANQYNHLILSGGGTKNLVDDTMVAGSLTRGGTAALSLVSGTTAKKLTYGASAEIVYAGTALQMTGAEFPALAVGISSLRVENAAGVKLHMSLLVRDSLTLRGNVDTGTNALRLAPGAACSGSGDVIGAVLRPDALPPGSYCFGNPNVLITLSPTATPPTSINVRLAQGTAPFSGAVLRRYTIEAPGFAGVAGLRLPYNSEELNGNDPSGLHLWRYSDGQWQLQPASARGVDAAGKQYIEKNNIGGFSDWTLADGGAPTAVTVIGFSAAVVDGHIRLYWQTASELDCVGFVIHRSHSSGERGERIAEVSAQAPGSPAGATYTWQEPLPPALAAQPDGTYYYWLDVIDRSAEPIPEPAPAWVRLPRVYLPALHRSE
jgi:hypothetical protein